jgi:hypothetical protein
VKQLLAAPSTEAKRVLAEAFAIATSDVRTMVDRDGNLLPIHALPDSIAPAVSSLKVTERVW